MVLKNSSKTIYNHWPLFKNKDATLLALELSPAVRVHADLH